MSPKVDTSPTLSPRWLSVDEVAEALGVSPKTVRRRIADGEIPARRIGGLIRVAESWLAEPGEPVPTTKESQ